MIIEELKMGVGMEDVRAVFRGTRTCDHPERKGKHT